MLGCRCYCYFFFWMSSCLGASLATSDQGTDVIESCFLYPVNDGTSSPYYDISGEGDHFVTVNHIFSETNVVRFVDEGGSCVVGLTLNTSECNETLPSDGEYTTVVYRRLNNTLKAYKTNSLVDVVDLSPDIQKLRITSNKMVNVAFDCPGNCYTFEKATIHINYTQVTGSSSFKMFGRKKPSPDEKHLLAAEVVYGVYKSASKSVKFSKLNLEVASQEWFPLEFHVSFTKQQTVTHDSYRMELNVKNPWSWRQDNHNLTLSTKDLYLNFSQSVNVLWAIPCIPPT
ncbi:uncharacterized protein LOC135213959 [Macrobrachium nipponense]|uniref:uncharacterized protein LOC135213959 n=1 Tax=Macrobrachium nipponense TaxID=159736 RepID=UPI0030C7DEEE